MKSKPKVEIPQLFDVNVERGILGCLLLGEVDAGELRDKLAPKDFGDQRHRMIYETCLVLAEKGQTADVALVASELRRRDKLDKVGGEVYLGTLLTAGCLASQVEAYIAVIRRLAVRRELFWAGQLITELSCDETLEPEEALAKAKESLEKIVQHGMIEPVKLSDLVATRIEKLAEGTDVSRLVDTGFADLDVILGGFGPGNLIILAARPGMGKTSLGLQIAVNVARAGKHVLFFSLEMGPNELVDRVLAWEGGLDTVVMRRKVYTEEETDRLWQIWPKTGEWKLYLDCSPALSTAQIIARSRRMKNRCGLDLVVIDYLQRITEPVDRTIGSRNELVGVITSRLKSAALDLEVPFLTLSQLNRNVETTQDRDRKDKRPGLAHLRDSGNIEQDADCVMFIYRRDYYWPDELQNKGKAEIIVAKQRNGPVGSAWLKFKRHLAQFEALDPATVRAWE